jgi:release factor glutamine methyltransferase
VPPARTPADGPGGGAAPYVPTLAPEEVARIRRWHEAAYAEIRASLPARVTHLGVDLEVPEGVFPPAPLTAMGEAILAEVRPGDRVLDMGSGSGVNAILAARVSRDVVVVGVDVNPAAVAAAAANAERNGVADRTMFLESDLFERVDGHFDLVVFDPPFRWFRPRDALEAAMTDEGYRTLGRFVGQVGRHLREGGRVLVFFGTSADFAHLERLVDGAGFSRTVVGEARASREGHSVTYAVLRLTRP